jgi:hypothetical protein
MDKKKMSEGLSKYREGVKNGSIVPVRNDRPSMIQAIKAKCKDCMSDYVDGRLDCEIPDCSLYYWMPYGQLRKSRNKKSKVSVMV